MSPTLRKLLAAAMENASAVWTPAAYRIKSLIEITGDVETPPLAAVEAMNAARGELIAEITAAGGPTKGENMQALFEQWRKIPRCRAALEAWSVATSTVRFDERQRRKHAEQ